MVKVVTWVEYAAASDPEIYVVGPMTAAPTYDDSTLIWVTAEPELKKFCTAFRDEQNDPALTLRLQQVLGLPPVEVARSEFAEFWVHPRDLIRPAPDPEITDHEAELEFPVSDEIVKIDDAYKGTPHETDIYLRLQRMAGCFQ